MVLGRRKRKSQWQRLRDAVWPRSGVRRGAKYIAYRVVRLPGTAYSIAAGVAAGAAVSFTPFLGFHFILGGLLALVTGGNVLASVIGTAVGNPWSFPFIWSLIYTIGRWLLGMGEGEGVSAALTMSDIFRQPMDVLYPMTVGAIPAAITAWIVFFIPVYAGVRRYQALRLARRRHRVGRRSQALRNDLRRVKGEHG
jgi:hypothetical protein